MDEKYPGIPKTHQPDQCCGRISIADLIRQEARLMRNRAHNLELLADQFDATFFGREADSELFEIISAHFCRGIGCR